MSTNETPPDAPAMRGTMNPNTPHIYAIEVACPYCNRIHVHGWAGPGEVVGLRAAHCGSGARYNVTVPANMKVEVEQ